MQDFERFLALLRQLPLDPASLPEYRDALAVQRVLANEPVESIAQEIQRPARSLHAKVEAIRQRGLAGLIPKLDEYLQREEPRRQGIAQMLLGKLTERRFELLIPEITQRRPGVAVEPRLAERSTTDYLLLNGYGHAVSRINIKFHGTLFNDAQALVELPPEDCFALATYKIFAALARQTADRYPYVFFVLSIPGLTAASVAGYVPANFVWLLSAVKGRRIVEEAIAAALSEPAYEAQFHGILTRMDEGSFRVISASKAFELVRQRLFARVYALRVPRFAQNYRNAEVDMHFSLTQDLTPVEVFLDHLERDPFHVLTVRLERGEL